MSTSSCKAPATLKYYSDFNKKIAPWFVSYEIKYRKLSPYCIQDEISLHNYNYKTGLKINPNFLEYGLNKYVF